MRKFDDDFPGDRLNAEAIRREARRLGWPDEDIVDQIAGGGFEGRFDCPLTTVLAFHHQGVVKPPKGMEHCEARSAGAGVEKDFVLARPPTPEDEEAEPEASPLTFQVLDGDEDVLDVPNVLYEDRIRFFRGFPRLGAY